MNPVTALKLGHIGNPSAYALAIWYRSDVSSREKYEALRGLNLFEFEDVGKQIVRAFNRRTNKKVLTFESLPLDELCDEDVECVTTNHKMLVRALQARQARQELMLNIIDATTAFSPKEIMTIVVNSLLAHANGNARMSKREWTKLTWQPVDLNNVRKLGLEMETERAVLQLLEL